MAFLDDLLSPKISHGFVPSPRYQTQRIELPSGKVRRNILREDPIYSYSLSYRAVTVDYDQDNIAAYEELRNLFFRTRGAHSFRFKDWADYQLNAEVFATGVAADQTYQLTKTYGTADGYEWVRNIIKPVTAATVYGFANRTPMAYFIDGVEDTLATVDSAGIVTFNTAIAGGEVLTATGHFDVPVMFERDDFPMTYHNYRIGSVPVDLMEDTNL